MTIQDYFPSQPYFFSRESWNHAGECLEVLAIRDFTFIHRLYEKRVEEGMTRGDLFQRLQWMVEIAGPSRIEERHTIQCAFCGSAEVQFFGVVIRDPKDPFQSWLDEDFLCCLECIDNMLQSMRRRSRTGTGFESFPLNFSIIYPQGKKMGYRRAMEILRYAFDMPRILPTPEQALVFWRDSDKHLFGQQLFYAVQHE